MLLLLEPSYLANNKMQLEQAPVLLWKKANLVWGNQEVI
jgi:hypothetical protein